MARFSANLGFLWPELPLLQRIAAAARGGFHAIELHWPYDTPAVAVRDACAAHALTLVGVNASAGDLTREFGLGVRAADRDRFRAGIDEAIAWAVTAGAGAVHAVSGSAAPADRAAARAVFADNLAWAAPRAAAHGLVLMIEPMNRFDRPDYLVDCVATGQSLIEQVGAPNLKLMADAYHIGRTEGDPWPVLQAAMADIHHIQIAAVPSRAEPDEGEVDYQTLFPALDAAGYTGWIGAEYRPRTTTDAGLGWLRAAQSTLARL